MKVSKKPKFRSLNAPYSDRFDDNPLYRHVEDAQRFRNKVTYYPGVMKFFKTLEALGGNVRWLSTWEWETQRFKTMLSADFDFSYLSWNRDHVYPGMNITDSRDVNKYNVVKKTTEVDNLPFVWVDDSATRLFDANDFKVPALAVRPDKPTGFDRTHAVAIKEFLDKTLNITV